MKVYPLVFEPILQRRIWGGRRLERYGKRLPPDTPIGESWELADLEQGQSVVRAGPAKGKTLGELVRVWGSDLLGGVELFEGRFPLLIKFLDAHQVLSVQVHPDEAVARRLGGDVRAKNEAWYVIEADPDGLIYHGLADGVEHDAFATALAQGRTQEMLRRIPVRPGDCHYLPGGTVHALGGGVVVAEIQTPSDTTFRLYDWDRVDPATGQARELHVEQALESVNFSAAPDNQERSHVASLWTTVTQLVTCESFVIERVRMREGFEQELPCGGLTVWIVLEGRGQLRYPDAAEPLTFTVGDTVLLPAALSGTSLKVLKDACWLEVSVPSPRGSAKADRVDARAQAPPPVGSESPGCHQQEKRP